MAWTTPKSWAVNDLVTATDLNTHLRDNLQYLRDRKFYSGLWSSTTPASTTNNTWSPMTSALTLTITHPNTPGFSLTYLAGFFGSFSVNSTTAEWLIGISENGDSSTKYRQVGKAMVANVFAPVGGTFIISLGPGVNTLSLNWAVTGGAQLSRAYGWRIWAVEIAETAV
jgi:hypothetical protein